MVFSGWEFDNIAFGVFTEFREMQNVALGLAIGNTISIFGLTLAFGALVVPVETNIATDYVVMTAVAPLLLIPVLVSGTLTPVLGIMFIMVYIVIFAYIIQRERQLDHTVMQADEVREAVTAPDGAPNIQMMSRPRYASSPTTTGFGR